MTWWHSSEAGKGHKALTGALLFVMIPTAAAAHGVPGGRGNESATALDWLLTGWSWRPDVLLFVAVLGIVYTAGWWRLKKQRARIAKKWQLGLYLTGLAIICLALLSPVDTFGSSLFFVHMIQHELLIMVAPPLLLLANSLPVVLWGLPRSLRRTIGRLFLRGAFFRQVVRAVTWMPVAWFLYVATLWGWHHPIAYQLALRNEILHDLEHLSFFLTGILFWWPVVNPAPRLHGHIAYGFRILYVFLAAGQNTLLSAVLGLTERVLYPYYTTAPRLFGLTALEDQVIGAAIMWVPGGMMYVITTLVLLNCHFDHEERVTRRAEMKAAVYASNVHGATPGEG